jgi:hypothetical protein
MEHDIDRLIRKKILEEETKVVEWNRSAVWSKINPTPGEKEFYFSYSIAAAALLAGLLLFYSLQILYSEKLYHRLHQLQGAIKNHEKQKLSPPATNDALTAICEEPLIEKDEQRVSPVQANQMSSYKPKSLSDNNEPVMTLVENTFTQDTLDVLRDTIDARKNMRVVQAIIGVVPQDTSPVKLTLIKKRKIRFDFFRLQEKGTFPQLDEETKSIVARIK